MDSHATITWQTHESYLGQRRGRNHARNNPSPWTLLTAKWEQKSLAQADMTIAEFGT